jgi:hypothetical protein
LIESNGPYDAILGFSQGSTMLSMMTALQLARCRESRGGPPPWRLSVHLCPVDANDLEYRARLRAAPEGCLPAPAILVYGRSDRIFYTIGQVP